MLDFLKGWRTYIAQVAQFLIGAAGVLILLNTYFGSIPIENGITLGGVLLALANVAQGAGGFFQRLATQSLREDLIEIIKIGGGTPPVAPAPAPDPQFPSVPGRIVPILLAALLLGGSAAWAVQPVAIINGPRHGEPGEELIYDLSQSEGAPTLFRWKVSPELTGRKQLTVLEGGAKCRLASYPGTYYIRGMVANAEGIDDHVFKVVIPGTVPCPPPDPNVPAPVVPVPGPTPVVPVVPVPTPMPVVPPAPPMPVIPVLPPGEFGGLPAAVYALAEAVVSPGKVDEAHKLADAFDATAAQISAGTLKGPVAIVAAVGAAFNGSVPPAWDSGFRTKAIAKMKAIFDGGQLSTSDKWAVMLREVSLGLRAVK